MKCLSLLLLFFATNLFGQYQAKVDSTLNHYFKVTELELGKIKIDTLDNYKFYYSEIILDDGQKVYVNKYVGDAINFFEDISGIKSPRIHRAQVMCPKLDEKTLELWKNWIGLNREKISWCLEKNKPCTKN